MHACPTWHAAAHKLTNAKGRALSPRAYPEDVTAALLLAEHHPSP